MTENSLPETAGVEYRIMPDYPAYAVGDDGSVWSKVREKSYPRSKANGRWKPLKLVVHHSGGYLVVTLCENGKRASRLVHALVLEAFIGSRPSTYHTRHLNGNPQDNRVGNLCWGTAKENSQDAVRHGTNVLKGPKGSKHPFAKLSEEDVVTIRARCKRGELQETVAADFPVGRNTVSRIVNRRRWKHI